MKPLSHMFSLFWILCICLPGAAYGDRLILTQEQAIALALEKNFNIRIKEWDPAIQQQRIRQELGSFDPTWSADYTRSSTRIDADSWVEESLSTSVSGKLPTGTRYSIGLETTEDSTAIDRSTTSHTAFAGITLTQPMLKGFGLNTNWAWVKIADRQHKISEWELQQTALDVVLQVIQNYNGYFLARQNAEVAVRNRDLAEQLVADNRKRIEQGMMSPVDIAVAEAELAVREERVLRTQGYLKIQENSLKNLLFNDYQKVLSTSLQIDQLPEPIEPKADLMQDFALVLEQQPEFKIRQINREIESIQLEYATNQQRLDLSLHAGFGRMGYGSSMQDSISSIGKNSAHETSVGLSMNYAIPNRSAKAEQAMSRIRLRQADLGIEQMKQDIMLNLQSIIIMVETNWNRIQASRKARELSNQMLEAEQKKLQAGTSSTFVVLRLQNDVASAQIQEFQTTSDYNISLAQLARLKGVL